MRKTIEINEKGVEEIVEHADVKKQHPYDCLKIKDGLSLGVYTIDVYLDCSCGKNFDQHVVSFCDNRLLSADDNFKGWFSNVCTWFIQNGYKIVDTRQGKECFDEN